MRKLLDSPWFYFSLAGLLVAFAIASMFEIRLPSRPLGTVRDLETLKDRDDLNVVFILIDTLRADRLGMYGYERDTSPIMDLLASDGIRFARVESQSSWTKASMASMWTSMYPRRAGMMQYQHSLPTEFKLPAEQFKEHGYVTGGIYRNGWVDANFGFSQGFDVYLKPRPSATPARFQRNNPSSKPLQGTDLEVTESAIEFLHSHGHQPFFLYLHYMDVHQYLFDDEAALFGTSLSDSYDNAIRWTDRNVSATLGTLQDLGILDRTIVVIASDHGESFYEHGQEGHARTLYREVTHTPLIIVPPTRIEGGVVVEKAVQNTDIWPTIFDLLGWEDHQGDDGRSLVPMILEAGGVPVDPATTEDRATFAEIDRNWGKGEGSRVLVATADQNYRYVHPTWAEDAGELYDRSDDPKEIRDVAKDNPELVADMRAKVEAYLEKDAAFTSAPVELDEMRKSQLRALGYALDK